MQHRLVKALLYFIPLIGLICSCHSKTKNNSSSSSVVFSTSNTYAFSDTIMPDSFKVTLKGASIEQAKLHFSITNHLGKEIYRYQIGAKELLKNYPAATKLKTNEQKESFLEDLVSEFLDDQHFLEPAVMPDDKADNNVPDKKFYNELKLSRLNGFEFSIGNEQKNYIAWSVADNSVKIYYQLK